VTFDGRHRPLSLVTESCASHARFSGRPNRLPSLAAPVTQSISPPLAAHPSRLACRPPSARLAAVPPRPPCSRTTATRSSLPPPPAARQDGRFGLHVAHRMLSEGRVGPGGGGRADHPTSAASGRRNAGALRPSGWSRNPPERGPGPEPRDPPRRRRQPTRPVAFRAGGCIAAAATSGRRWSSADEAPTHMGEGRYVGPYDGLAPSPAPVFRLLLSPGTPFRSDNLAHPVGRLRRGWRLPRADYGYGYTDALVDGVPAARWTFPHLRRRHGVGERRPGSAAPTSAVVPAGGRGGPVACARPCRPTATGSRTCCATPPRPRCSGPPRPGAHPDAGRPGGWRATRSTPEQLADRACAGGGAERPGRRSPSDAPDASARIAPLSPAGLRIRGSSPC